MNTLDKQIQGIIQDSISRNMSVSIPLQNNDNERNMLVQIMREQGRIEQQIRGLRIAIENLRCDISVIKHHHEYNC